MTSLNHPLCHSGFIQDFEGFSISLCCCAKPEGSICLFTSKQILPVGFIQQYMNE